MSKNPDAKREFLRHTLATVAYRGGKALRGAPEHFANMKISETSRTPLQVLAHLCDLYDWAISVASGKEAWHNSVPASWSGEVDRFFECLDRFDEFLSSNEPMACDPERLFQGPVADSLSHIGQIAMMRRVAEAAIKGEDYSHAEIASGRVGKDQIPPKREFD
jgi:hypothetical protein